MARITQHVPAFVQVDNFEKGEFKTTEELLALPWIKRYEHEGFCGYALSHSGNQTLLMAVYNRGKNWWVVGYIDDASNIDLPEWEEDVAPRNK